MFRNYHWLGCFCWLSLLMTKNYGTYGHCVEEGTFMSSFSLLGSSFSVNSHGVYSLYCDSCPVVGLQEVPGTVPLSYHFTNY